MRIPTLVAAFAALCLPAIAAEKELTDLGYRGQFLRAGGVFSCMVPAEQHPDPKVIAENLNQPCLYLGPVGKRGKETMALGQEGAPLLMELGKPYQIVPERTSISYIYPLAEIDPAPYLVVVVEDERVVDLQVSGNVAVPGMNFNGIDLGVGVDNVRATFGAPFKVSDSGLPKTDLWSYSPWTFSFEVNGDKVTSIRIWQ